MAGRVANLETRALTVEQDKGWSAQGHSTGYRLKCTKSHWYWIQAELHEVTVPVYRLECTGTLEQNTGWNDAGTHRSETEPRRQKTIGITRNTLELVPGTLGIIEEMFICTRGHVARVRTLCINAEQHEFHGCLHFL